MAQLELETRTFDSKFKIPFQPCTSCVGKIVIHFGDAPFQGNKFSQQLENRQEEVVMRERGINHK